MDKIMANLWFDGNAEAAAELYTSVVPNSRITTVARCGEAGREITGGEPGAVMSIDFELDKYGVSWQVILATEEPKQTIIPAMLFVGERCGRAREALEYYTSVFRNSRPAAIFTYGPDNAPEDASHVMYGDATLEGTVIVAMDSSLDHRFGVSWQMKKLDIVELRRASESVARREWGRLIMR